MLATVQSATLDGVEGCPVRVEVHVANGLPGFNIVGQPDVAGRESRDRVRAALLSSGFKWPLQRITVNLAPGSVRKVGAGFDLPIAVGLLIATGELRPDCLGDCSVIGEIGLDGALRSVPGIIAMVGRLATPGVIVPDAAGPEAVLAGGRVLTAPTLRQLVAALNGQDRWGPAPSPALSEPGRRRDPDLADVRGQLVGRWAVEVAAAGGHHLLMVGPPGAGKTMLAERLPGLLPDLTDAEALETTRLWSVANLLQRPCLIRRPPLLRPHHSASPVALIGGGTGRLRPGEISLATNGVLLLDEMAEFPAAVLDALRQPLEEGHVTISRAQAMARFPARFLLVGATNPCPCGYGLSSSGCRCSGGARDRYSRRISGPLLDRFDLRITVAKTDVAELMGQGECESTAVVAARVQRVRALAAERGISFNSQIPQSRLEELAPLERGGADLLRRRLQAGRLNPRGLHRVWRVARTIADLAGDTEVIKDEWVAGALELRPEEALLRAQVA
jgi:magnesium chelatase family protein